MKAIKGNKEYIIDETQRKHYIDVGYDIVDENGKTINYGRGKIVPYEDYVKACREIERLHERIAELEKGKARKGGE